jgi:alkanesulfonate monooxygenase SsuD/methylene tetrahydromethanopterin reductase-like flavin-dependent oxidoreductase (luciferase family)
MARLGITVYHGVESGARLRDLARLAEAVGFDSLWVTERYFHEEAFASLGYLAAATERIGLGVGVVNAHTRHPALLAMAAATLQRLSGGRLLLGLGTSDRDVIEGRLGLDYGAPRERLAEAVGVLRSLLAGGGSTSHDGRFRLREARLTPPPQTPPPIYLAAIGLRALRLAGALGDGVLLNAYSPPGYVRWAVEQVRDASRAAGRDPATVDIACMLVVRPSVTPDAIAPELRRRLVRLLVEPRVGEVLLERGGFDVGLLPRLRALGEGDAAASLIPDALVDACYLLGPAERVRARVEEYRAAGVGLPIVLPRLEDFASVASTLAG